MRLQKQGLYDPAFEHDACGIGFIANVDGKKEHTLIEDGITILCNMEHRGAVGGDHKSGDGAGMMLQIPHRFFEGILPFKLPAAGTYGVGFLFLPPQETKKAREMCDQVAAEKGFKVLGWREVPVNPEALGAHARETMPALYQLFVQTSSSSEENLERRLYVLRKCLENAAVNQGWNMEQFYVSSLSAYKIIYKGMFVSEQFSAFYPDLTDQKFESAFVMVHQRYSTNTFPSWPLAQPFRFIAHNGEINTIRGNTNKLQDRYNALSSPLFGKDINKVVPVLNAEASDSSCFDNAYELLTLSGRSMEHVMMMMVPEAFGNDYHISQDLRAFYEYHMTIMDPWDGPAALLFSDGIKVGAYLDRNGLRPGRYTITKSGRVVMASETGVLEIDPADVLEKGRLAPGKMLVVDTSQKRVIKDKEIKSRVSRWKPYRRWLEENKIELKGLFQVPADIQSDGKYLRNRQIAFGYTLEDLKMILLPMVLNSQEAIGSMGNDAALAVLSQRPQLLYNYFKQRFAQVTNPPIDPYREKLVMSLSSWVGRQSNLLDEKPEHCRQLKLPHPVLTNDDIERLKNTNSKAVKVSFIPMCFEPRKGALQQGLKQLGLAVEAKVDQGYTVVVLSDRQISKKRAAIPALLATSEVHQHLVKQGKRHLVALLLETGEAREVHHFATLLSYGASGINPYLVYECIVDLQQRGYIPASLSLPSAYMHFNKAINKGLLKVMSKMGISTLRSYRHAQTFEALGLDENFTQRYFPGTPSRIGGIGLDVVEQETLKRHANGFSEAVETERRLPSGGFYHNRHTGEAHNLSAEALVLVQRAVRENNYQLFKQYSAKINDRAKEQCTLRGLFSFSDSQSVPLAEVEAEDSIIKRFVTSAMSFGSISKEAHETMAIAMNRLGAQSNSGEGGEDESRYQPLANGDSAKSKIKQIASARFGVTSNYLVNSEELQIKMAQGAKPGEGGQLPGFKVDETIARVRHATPGVMLISPPPHHDIYSIEDLAQLIFDLKSGNPRARISVKLVSEVGVGTVAAGVAKAKTDMILISGSDGGTGASPWSSIKHTGSAWEIGLAETQQVLMMNNLRDRVRVQVDGQLKTGRDVVIGALLGAEEFGFGTMSLISMGCVMMRKCHLNTCPVGVATQDPRLRARFKGSPEHVINFMRFIAREVRELMAALGFRTFEEMVGRRDLLQVDTAVQHFKTQGLDFSPILNPLTGQAEKSGRYCRAIRSQRPPQDYDQVLIKESRDALENKKAIRLAHTIRNYDRAVGATLSAEVSRRYGSAGLPKDSIHIDFKGSAGQSFGAFLAPGITFCLEGDANDHVGKGLSGGIISIRPPRASTFRAHTNIVTGNVNLFGATSGELYVNGLAGERFAVRNSGALAVVEGVGDHGCEYMTGGQVIVLGRTGVNFAAGMSGGIAYVLDENQLFDTRCNLEMVDIEPLSQEEDIQFLKSKIERHCQFTDSRLAAQILDNWDEVLPSFVKVMPVEYRRALERIEQQRLDEEGQLSLTEEVYD